MDTMLIKALSQSQGLAANLLWGDGVDRARPEEASKSLEEALWGKQKGRPALAAKNSRLQCLMSTLMPVCLGTVVIFMRKMQKG